MPPNTITQLKPRPLPRIERYDPETLDTLSRRHAELLQEVATIRSRISDGDTATALEQLAAFDMMLRGFIETHEALLLSPLEKDWGGEQYAHERILLSRSRWRAISARFASIAEELAAVDCASTSEVAALDFRFAHAAHELGDALREERASLFLLFLAPHRAPGRPR